MCGEHYDLECTLYAGLGSSPRVRGTCFSRLPLWLPLGIIPACAGNILRVSSSYRGLRDHPRVCGEHRELTDLKPAGQGSSPRVRGTCRYIDIYYAGGGIIPACAGNMRRQMRLPPACRDHPRVCGEHVPLNPRKGYKMGSSPRVRGTLSVIFLASKWSRIIPACAGNIKCNEYIT